MKAKIKNKLREWLGINNQELILADCKKRIEFLESLVKIGTDVDVRDKSWAVVCLRGRKQEYVSFVDLGARDCQSIMAVFSRFNRDNKWYDFPHGMTKELFIYEKPDQEN